MESLGGGVGRGFCVGGLRELKSENPDLGHSAVSGTGRMRSEDSQVPKGEAPGAPTRNGRIRFPKGPGPPALRNDHLADDSPDETSGKIRAG